MFARKKEQDPYAKWLEKESPWKKPLIFPLPLLAVATFVIICVIFYHWLNPKVVGRVTRTQIGFHRSARGNVEFLNEAQELYFKDEIEVEKELGKLWFNLEKGGEFVADKGSKFKLLDNDKIQFTTGRLWTKTTDKLTLLVPEGTVKASEATFILECTPEKSKISVIKAATPVAFEINQKTVEVQAGHLCEAFKGKFPGQPLPTNYIPETWTQPSRLAAEGPDLSLGSVLSGILMDRQSLPVQGIVYLRSKLTGTDIFAPSDDRGNYTVSAIRPGDYIINVKARGYRSILNQTIQFPDKPAYLQQSFILEKANSIRLRILDAYDRYVEDPQVVVKDEQDHLVPRYNIWPEPDGGITITDLEPGRFSLIITKTGYAGKVLHDVPVDSDEILVTLLPAGKISGRVVRNSDSTPIRDFSIRIVSFIPFADTPLSYDMNWRDFETRQGRFILEGLNPGKYSLAVIHPDFTAVTMANIPVTAANTTSGLEFRMAEPGSIRGVVREKTSRKPVPSAEVALYQYDQTDLERLIRDAGHAVSSDASGHFAIERVPAGDVRLRVASPDYLVEKTDFIKVSSGKQTNVEIFLESGAGISGAVRTPSGNTLADYQVRLLDNTNSGIITTTNSRGEYIFSHLRPGVYTLITGTIQSPLGQIRVKQKINNQNNHTADLQFPAGAAVSGSIKTPHGKIIPAAILIEKKDQDTFSLIKSSLTDNNGRYSFRNIPPGEYSVTISPSSPPGEYHDTLTVEQPQQDITKNFTVPTATQSQ